ncbi:hypothetical protein F2Q69_00005789 [Brassica cretica]|uniref:Uncharacterized protein n=1 Tax=Brassica cretica TaxID=69181 RepID=A0A8S9NTU3_BRACR|nr:hypothetical protein F2Q69_00005789 [Brassica cretica]
MRLLNHLPVKSRIASSPLRHFSFIVAVVFSIFCNLSPRLSRLPRFVALSTDVCLGMSVDLLLRLSVDADAYGRRAM